MKLRLSFLVTDLSQHFGIYIWRPLHSKFSFMVKSLLPDQHSLSMKILRVSFVGYSMSSGINQFIKLSIHLTMVGN